MGTDVDSVTHPVPGAGTPPDLLGRWWELVDAAPAADSVRYLDDRGAELVEQRRSRGELADDVAVLAADLASRRREGERALVLTAPGLPFLVSFLAALQAGVVAVPAPLPGDVKGLARLEKIVRDAGVSEVLTTSDLLGLVTGWLDSVEIEPRPDVTAVDLIESEGAQRLARRTPDPDAVAFLQYTSGSTSDPKGVMVTFGNLVHNLGVIDRACRTGESGTVCQWLPHFHDMGLIGGLLYPLYAGALGVHLSPATFLKRPHVWLRSMSEWRATGTVAPNFAFEMCARRVRPEQMEGVDLSRLSTILNGSEPVRAETLTAFNDMFAAYGLRETSLAPCYGLAESTLMVTCDGVESFCRLDVDPAGLGEGVLRPPGDAVRTLVGSGQTHGLEVLVVDPATGAVVPDGTIGEIRVRGGSVAAGYWRNPEATAVTFDTVVDGIGGYLRTGDLGAMVGGELFVTGRLKDLMIVNGRNIYPHDLEQSSAAAHPALAGGLTAVFAVGEADELVVVVQEFTAEPGPVAEDELRRAVRDAIRHEHEVAVSDVVLVPRKTVSRTTSGKIRRAEMRERYLDGEFAVRPETTVGPAARLVPTSVVGSAR